MNVENSIDVFEIKYKSPLIRISAAILSILTTGGLLIGQIVAAKSLVNALNITNDYIFITLALSVILYAVLGGLKTAGLTYNIQLVYTIVIFGAIFGFCAFMEPPSFFANLLTRDFLLTDHNITFSSVFACLVMPALYYLTDQEFARPFFNITSKRQSAISAISASIFILLFSLIPIYFGIKAHMYNVNVSDDISPLIPVLNIMTNKYIVIIAVIGIATALIAMIDYYLWALSLSINYEIGLTFTSLQENITLQKITVFIVGIIAIGSSYCTSSNALQVLLYSYELYDSCLIVPLLMSYFQSDLKKGCAIGAFISGLAGFIIIRLIVLPVPGQLASLILSFIGFYCGGLIESFITRLSNFNARASALYKH